MKQLITIIAFALAAMLYSQTEQPKIRLDDLNPLSISEGVSLHIISPEPIQFVDLSTNNIIGDLPAENIARIKIAEQGPNDSINIDKTNPGIVTIVGQSFIAQYRLHYTRYENSAISNIQIQPEDMQPLELAKTRYSNIELEKFAMNILRKKRIGTPIRKEREMQLEMRLNNVYVVNEHIFLDITFENYSNLPYTIDNINFSIEDKKIYKATNNQSIEIVPHYMLYHQPGFKKTYRNIFVFDKFTYPNSKILKIRLVEKQLSGRTIEMKVNYSDILSADTF